MAKATNVVSNAVASPDVTPSSHREFQHQKRESSTVRRLRRSSITVPMKPRIGTAQINARNKV